MITLRDNTSMYDEPIGAYLDSAGYEYARDWSFKLSSIKTNSRIIGVVTISAESHCPELESLLALKYSEFIV